MTKNRLDPTHSISRRLHPWSAVPALVLILACGGKGGDSPQDLARPALHSVAPDRGTAGTAIRLSGDRLDTVACVFIGEVEAPFTRVNAQELQFTVPAGARTALIHVRTSKGEKIAGPPFTIPDATATLLSFSPSQVHAGGEIVLVGMHLSGVTGVNISGLPATITKRTDFKVSAKVPLQAASGLVQVQLRDGRTFEYSGHLHVLPAQGPGGGIAPATSPGDAAPVRGSGLKAFEPADDASPTPTLLPEDLRRIREECAAIPEALARQEAARVALRNAVGALQNYTSTGNHTIVRPRHLYKQGKRELDYIATRQPEPGEYRINYACISADPYLAHHNQDIHLLVPDEVTDEAFREIQDDLVRADAGQAGTLRNMFAIVNRSPSVRSSVRKRFKRLYDHTRQRMVEGEPSELGNPTLMHDLAFKVNESCAAGGRCIDGIQNGLSILEEGFFPGGGAGPAEHLGQFISSVFTDYKHAFLRRHIQFLPEDAEFRTMIVQNLGQSMLYSLGLRGGGERLAYPDHGFTAQAQFQPAAVMRRFLEGGAGLRLHNQASPSGASPWIEFEPFNVEKMVSLLQEARLFSMRRNAAGHSLPYVGSPASQLTNALIVAELVDPGDYTSREPVLGAKLREFEIVNAMAVGNEYFEPAPEGEPPGLEADPGLLAAYAAKYNYILPNY